MTVGIVPAYDIFLGDEIFSSVVAGKEIDTPFSLLKRRLEKEGHACHTVDRLHLSDIDVFLFMEMPHRDNTYHQYALEHRIPTVLLIMENRFIWCGNSEYGRYGDFSRVLTYDDEAVRHHGARKINYTCGCRVTDHGVPWEKRKFAAMIATRWMHFAPNLRYHVRMRTIRFYERKHPGDFDLYGRGWDEPSMRFCEYPGASRWARKLGIAGLIPKDPHPLWRGTLLSKAECIGKYRFVYCYENTDRIPGYITEKLLDVLQNGAIPIYYGHASTGRYIPEACYVDRARFGSDEALYRYLKAMDADTAHGMLSAADAFFHSAGADPFRHETVVDILVRTLEELGGKRLETT